MKNSLKLWFAERSKNTKITKDLLDELIARKLAKKSNEEKPLCYCRNCGGNEEETFEYAKNVISISTLLGILDKLSIDRPSVIKNQVIVLNNCYLCRKKNEPYGVRLFERNF